MPRMSKKHPMNGSLRLSDGSYRPTQLVWDAKYEGYFVKDGIARRRYGPYGHVGEMRRDGLKFYADNGRRANGGRTYHSSTTEIIVSKKFRKPDQIETRA